MTAVMEPKSLKPGMILLVEDNPDDERLALMGLQRAEDNHSVQIARDGEQAIVEIDRSEPGEIALVLLDLKLPNLNVPTDPTSAYNFKGPEPEAIIVNLGTNDFGKGNPEEAEWIGAYKGFLARLRYHYPKAFVYVAIGSMMSDNFPEGQLALSTIRNYLTRMVDSLRAGGDTRIRLLEFDQQSSDDGYGAAYHPNLITDRKMAAKFEDALHQDLRW